MKNILIHTSPKRQFTKENLLLSKIQIDNSLDLGWKPDDIVFITDFPFSYNGVKSLVISPGVYYDFDVNANKIPVIAFLLKHNLLQKSEVYWCHDFDAYQMHSFTDAILTLPNVDLGLTHYSYKPEWQCGSIFFKSSAQDIFDLIHQTTITSPYKSRNNEKTLTKLIAQNAIDSRRFTRLNSTYNFMKRYIETIYRQAEKPLKVLHFHPWDKDALMEYSALEMFMYGKNKLHIPLMNKRLIQIFHDHGIA